MSQLKIVCVTVEMKCVCMCNSTTSQSWLCNSGGEGKGERDICPPGISTFQVLMDNGTLASEYTYTTDLGY